MGILPEGKSHDLRTLEPMFAETSRIILQTGYTTTALSRRVVGLVAFVAWDALVWWWMSGYCLSWVAWFWAA